MISSQLLTNLKNLNLQINYPYSIVFYYHNSYTYYVPLSQLQGVRPLAQAAEYKDAEFTPLSLFNFFVNRCCENLHIVLTMSSIREAFRDHLKQFPSLINCYTIDWFHAIMQVSIKDYHVGTMHTICLLQAWLEDALESVRANNFLQDIEMSDDERKQLCGVHLSAPCREQSKK